MPISLFWYETAYPISMWNQVQWTFITRFCEIWSEEQVATTLCYAKQNKFELVEDYYNWFLW
jgi:hypothetical protein